MLVIQRKAGEIITIGDSIKIVVLEGYCRLGIAAPGDQRILRLDKNGQIEMSKNKEIDNTRSSNPNHVDIP